MTMQLDDEFPSRKSKSGTYYENSFLKNIVVIEQ